jgi:hypothetical protein
MLWSNASKFEIEYIKISYIQTQFGSELFNIAGTKELRNV